MERAFYPDETFKANSDLSAKQFFLLELTAEDTVDVTNAAGDLVIGVLQNAPKSGEPAQVRVGVGITQVVTDGNASAIAVNDRLGTNNAGKAVKKTAADDLICGIALQASTADGTIISMLLIPPGSQRSA
jgi:hypothetical protein